MMAILLTVSGEVVEDRWDHGVNDVGKSSMQ
jgi:hypothetical protein